MTGKELCVSGLLSVRSFHLLGSLPRGFLKNPFRPDGTHIGIRHKNTHFQKVLIGYENS